MSALLPTPAPTQSWTWPADVLEFAAKKNVIHLLEPLRQAGLRLFPTGRLEVSLYQDHDIEDLVTICFDMAVSTETVPEWQTAEAAWLEELWRLYTPPRLVPISLRVRKGR